MKEVSGKDEKQKKINEKRRIKMMKEEMSIILND